MMDKKPHIKPYLYGMLAGFGAISLSILFFFFIYRFDGFGDAVSKVTGILMPFIYGAVIAYLLKPVCNTIEGFLHRIFPEKLHSMANMLAIAATLLFGVLVVYALVMMVVPQLITSVTSLYYTAQTSITRFLCGLYRLIQHNVFQNVTTNILLQLIQNFLLFHHRIFTVAEYICVKQCLCLIFRLTVSHSGLCEKIARFAVFFRQFV